MDSSRKQWPISRFGPVSCWSVLPANEHGDAASHDVEARPLLPQPPRHGSPELSCSASRRRGRSSLAHLRPHLMLLLLCQLPNLLLHIITTTEHLLFLPRSLLSDPLLRRRRQTNTQFVLLWKIDRWSWLWLDGSSSRTAEALHRLCLYS
jgi:hypothetical protein